MVPVVINQPATDTGDSLDIYNGATFTNGVLSGGTIRASILPTGAFQPKGAQPDSWPYPKAQRVARLFRVALRIQPVFRVQRPLLRMLPTFQPQRRQPIFPHGYFLTPAPQSARLPRCRRPPCCTTQYTNSTTGFTNVTGTNSLAFSLEANTPTKVPDVFTIRQLRRRAKHRVHRSSLSHLRDL